MCNFQFLKTFANSVLRYSTIFDIIRVKFLMEKKLWIVVTLSY